MSQRTDTIKREQRAERIGRALEATAESVASDSVGAAVLLRDLAEYLVEADIAVVKAQLTDDLVAKLEWLAHETAGINTYSSTNDNGDWVDHSDAFREAAEALKARGNPRIVTASEVNLQELSAEVGLRAAPHAEWVLVPREPTEAMIHAVWHHWLNGMGHSEECMANALRAMLRAAPAGPDPGGRS